MYAIVLDLDAETSKQPYPRTSRNNAYGDVRTYLTSRGFEWKQGSAYFGDDTIDAVRCVRAIRKHSKNYPWFEPAVRDIRMLRIEENNDLLIALDDEDED